MRRLPRHTDPTSSRARRKRMEYGLIDRVPRARPSEALGRIGQPVGIRLCPCDQADRPSSLDTGTRPQPSERQDVANHWLRSHHATAPQNLKDSGVAVVVGLLRRQPLVEEGQVGWVLRSQRREACAKRGLESLVRGSLMRPRNRVRRRDRRRNLSGRQPASPMGFQTSRFGRPDRSSADVDVRHDDCAEGPGSHRALGVQNGQGVPQPSFRQFTQEPRASWRWPMPRRFRGTARRPSLIPISRKKTRAPTREISLVSKAVALWRPEVRLVKSRLRNLVDSARISLSLALLRIACTSQA